MTSNFGPIKRLAFRKFHLAEKRKTLSASSGIFLAGKCYYLPWNEIHERRAFFKEKFRRESLIRVNDQIELLGRDRG